MSTFEADEHLRATSVLSSDGSLDDDT